MTATDPKARPADLQAVLDALDDPYTLTAPPPPEEPRTEWVRQEAANGGSEARTPADPTWEAEVLEPKAAPDPKSEPDPKGEPKPPRTTPPARRRRKPPARRVPGALSWLLAIVVLVLGGVGVVIIGMGLVAIGAWHSLEEEEPVETDVMVLLGIPPRDTDTAVDDGPPPNTPAPEVEADWVALERCPALPQYAGCTATGGAGEGAQRTAMTWRWNEDGRLTFLESLYGPDAQLALRIEATWEDDLLVREAQWVPDAPGGVGHVVFERTYDTRGVLWEETRTTEPSPESDAWDDNTRRYRYLRDVNGLIAGREGVIRGVSDRDLMYGARLDFDGWGYTLLVARNDEEVEALASGTTALRIGPDATHWASWHLETGLARSSRPRLGGLAWLDRGLPQHLAWRPGESAGGPYSAVLTYRDDCQPLTERLTDPDGALIREEAWTYDAEGRMRTGRGGLVIEDYDCGG